MSRYVIKEHRHLSNAEKTYSRKTASLVIFTALAFAGSHPLIGNGKNRLPELRVGFNAFIPFVIPGRDGATGLAVEVLNEAAKRAGVRLSYVPSGQDVDGALRSGKIDIFPLLTLTPQRVQEFHASQAWWDNEIGLISLESRPIEAPAGTSGKRIAIRGLPILKNLAEKLFPQAQLLIVPGLERMVSELCEGNVDAVFLDIRLLESQIMKGTRACVDHPLYVRTVPHGNLSMGTIARPGVAVLADRIYEKIADLAVDGMISAAASRYSIVSSAQNRNMKDILDAQRRAALLRYGMAGLSVVLLMSAFQTHRVRRSRAVAEESRQRFDAFMQHTPALTFIKDESGSVVYINQEIDALGPPGAGSRELALKLQELDGAVLQTNRSIEVSETVAGSTGDLRHFLCLKFPFAGASGPRFLGTVALDVTERKRSEEALRFSQFSIDRSPDPILWIDSDVRIFYANEAAARKLGFSREELLRMRFVDVDCGFGSLACARRRDELKSGGSMTLESHHRTKMGEVFPVELSLNYLELEGRGFICCMSRDITERKRAERELSYQAQHDQLTGLPNRRFFETRLEHCIGAAQLTASGLAVLYFDLDGFKLINDTHGHSLGDALLKQCVRRLQNLVRESDVLARMGGDEFTLIATGIDDDMSANALADKLLSSLQESFIVDGHELLVTASIGISVFPFHGVDGNTLLRHADAAMYEAKREGKNRARVFSPEMNVNVRERLELENQLRRALERGELMLHYQPEISLRTNQIVRNEALLRWNHPVLGSIPPSKFIPIAKETGLIIPIGTWVLEEACRETKKQFDSGAPAGVGVNVSSVQFSRPGFVETVIDVLRRTGLPPSLLELELTETVVMTGVEDVAEKIRELRTVGVSVSIDDFGTGYSSLSYLQKLRIDNLKIDRSFIRDIPCDPDALALTKALVSLAHSLGMRVVIEGIETRQQLEAIRGIGCDIGQGYLLGRPGPALPIPGMALAEIA